MRSRIDACLKQDCGDKVGELIAAGSPREGAAVRPAPRLPSVVRVPLLGEIRLAELSLPMATIALGALDGFNPCAMWALVFLLGLLVGLEDRLRAWLFGVAFIGASAVVYFLFMSAWLNVVLFLGMLTWVRVGIGIVALGGGGYHMRAYFLTNAETCEVGAPAARRRVLVRLRELASSRRFFAALGGIVALAVAVNLIEILCSAGLPVVYTQLLAMSALPMWQYYAYLGLYVLTFMLDDLLVFVTAMVTLQVTGLTTRYVYYSHLVGGVLLLTIGALLILRPEWLVFA